MRTIDALAVSLALIACLAVGRMGVQPSADELAAETWMLEQELVSLLGTMSSPAQACYAMTLPDATGEGGALSLALDRAEAVLATSCDLSMISQLA